MERTRAAILHLEGTPLADSIPYTLQTKGLLHSLADLQPRTLAVAHGSSFVGDGSRALRDLDLALRETFGNVGDPMPVAGVPERETPP